MAKSKVRRDPNLTAGEEKAIVGWTKQVRLEVLMCRQFGHAWTRGLDTVYRLGGDIIRQIGCDRCGMVRRDIVPIGEYGASRRAYVPPEDYRRNVEFGSSAVPRWAIADGVVDRSQQAEPQGDLLDWYYKRSGSVFE